MINVKVVCRSGAVLIGCRQHLTQMWSVRLPGVTKMLPRRKTPDEIMGTLAALAEDYGGVLSRQIFRETEEGVIAI
jgi:hypothetical protein